MFQAPHQLDYDTRMALDLPNIITLIDLDEIARMNQAMGEVKRMLAEGLRRAPDWANRYLQQNIDERLRLRFCIHTWNCWVVDRYCDEPFNCWMVVLKHTDDDGNPLPLNEIELYHIAKRLQAGDTKGKTPEELRAEKQAAADKIEKERQRVMDDKTLERVDNLSLKKLDIVKDALEALQSGGKIIAHGEDEKFLEHSFAKTQEAAAAGLLTAEDPRLCINPGHDPTRS